MRRLAERRSELPAEMRARETGGTGQIVDVERLRIPRVDEISGPQEVTLGGKECHVRQYPRR